MAGLMTDTVLQSEAENGKEGGGVIGQVGGRKGRTTERTRMHIGHRWAAWVYLISSGCQLVGEAERVIWLVSPRL